MNNIKTNVLFFVLTALIFTAYVTLFFVSPKDLIQWLTESYQLDHAKKELLSIYIREITWLKLKCGLIILSLALLYLFYYDKEILKEYGLSFSSFFKWIKNDYFSFSSKEKNVSLITIIGFAGALILYCAVTPLQLDELHTWLFYIDRGFLVTMAYYPGSNNHIAYNLFSIPWTIFLSPIWALRIVSILSAVGTITLFLLILKKRYTFLLSMAAILLLMSMACFSWYAVQGRGYVLELFFLIAILYILLRPEPDFAVGRLLVLFNALAIYCVPVAVFPVALLNAYYAYRLFLLDKRNVKRIVQVALYSICLTFLFYMSVGVFSGFSQLFNNPFVERVPYQEAFAVGCTEYIPRIWNFISGVEGNVSLLLFILLLAATLICLKRSRFIIVPFVVLLIPLFLFQCYPVVLFERTWLWLVIPFVFWCIEVIHQLTYRNKNFNFIIATLFIIAIAGINLLRSYTTNQLLVKNEQQFLTLKQIIDDRLAGKTIEVYNDELYDYLLFYQKENKTVELTYLTAPNQKKPDAFIGSWEHSSYSKDKVIWTDSIHVVYWPE